MARTIRERLGAKPGMTVAVLNPPAGHQAADLDDAPTGAADVVLAFVASRAEVAPTVVAGLARLRQDGRLWVAYPKRSSGIATDLSRDSGWEPLNGRGMLPVAQFPLDATWSAQWFRPRDEIRKLTRER